MVHRSKHIITFYTFYWFMKWQELLLFRQILNVLHLLTEARCKCVLQSFFKVHKVDISFDKKQKVVKVQNISDLHASLPLCFMTGLPHPFPLLIPFTVHFLFMNNGTHALVKTQRAVYKIILQISVWNHHAVYCKSRIKCHK